MENKGWRGLNSGGRLDGGGWGGVGRTWGKLQGCPRAPPRFWLDGAVPPPPSEVVPRLVAW